MTYVFWTTVAIGLIVDGLQFKRNRAARRREKN
jgi:hypothetical protein